MINKWNAKVGSQVSGAAGLFGLGVQSKAGQRLTELCQENVWSQRTPSPATGGTTLHVNITKG